MKGAPVEGAATGQFPPHLLATRTAGNQRLTAADLEHASVEIEHVGIDLKARRRNGVAKRLGGLGIQFRKT